MNKTDYKRRSVEKAIVMALRDLGGSASRKVIRKSMADNGYDGLTYDQVFYTKRGKTGTYSPFMFDFNFGIRNLYTVGYIEKPERGKDIVLTNLGQNNSLKSYPTKEQEQRMAEYWHKKDQERAERHASKAKMDIKESEDAATGSDDQEDTDNLGWKSQLLNQLMKFDPAKFESFSRLLISKMGVTIDKKRGIVRSGDHGIDGFGYFTSDEFRTSRVAIQCKRYTTGAVSEPEIDKFKGVMDSFNAEYGIFITTNYFTPRARSKATQGNNTVTLIDGQELADLVEKYQLHITPITTYALDDYYFDLK
ncbi:restriction endonuclease [uncultured Limosilactobacillus sp.]|uniref:restriction endonuclease n=1 Tax=uncultured Limosilactobacillus sp. TaxID=2837629 RepID=UPI0025F67AF1|nr:restriction endonuclease [uncultured Limosilactobacillus sp.]